MYLGPEPARDSRSSEIPTGSMPPQALPDLNNGQNDASEYRTANPDQPARPALAPPRTADPIVYQIKYPKWKLFSQKVQKIRNPQEIQCGNSENQRSRHQKPPIPHYPQQSTHQTDAPARRFLHFNTQG
jgi:hypothetical protein